MTVALHSVPRAESSNSSDHPLSPTDSTASTSTDHSLALEPEENDDATITPPTSHTHSSGIALKTPKGTPGGMDVRDVLAKCEDPALGWSMQFWVTIADPLTNHVFFACPATGTCSWEPPVGAFLLPRQPGGEWWELADAKRDNRSYYYNTMTGETQWTRPTGDAFVIPLGLIQQTALPPRSDSVLSRNLSPTQPRTNTPAHLSPNKRAPPDTLLSPISESPKTSSRSGPRPPPSPRKPSSTEKGPRSPDKENQVVRIKDADGDTLRPGRAPPPLATQPLSAMRIKDPIKVESPRHKRMSTGLHPVLPSGLTAQIQIFQTPEFANRHFATRRTGIRRQKVPLDRIMEWQRQPIASPILVLSQTQREAVIAFKVIQHVMGERDRPVEGARPHRPAAWQATATVHNGVMSDKTIVLEEIRWLIQLAVSAKEMRNEVYCQLVKQLTRNTSHDSVVLGFQLFCVFVNAFCPSSDFEPLVRTFLRRHEDASDNAIVIMAKYCLAKSEVMMSQGARAKMLTIGEIEAASDAAFYPSVYGESLERIMEYQERSYPNLKVPVILPFLADGILALGGTRCEGIFRIPGDNDSVSELKSRMDRGHYQLQGIENPHVAASLFKLWLRELESPVIPPKQYNACLTSSASSEKAVDFVRQLPKLNRRVLVFVITFFQLFITPEVLEVTKMTASNLALVLAPNLLRTTSDSLVTVFTNSSFESNFVLQLLNHLRPEDVDPGFIPSHGQVGL